MKSRAPEFLPANTPDEPVVLHVTILYEDNLTVRRAKELCARVISQLDLSPDVEMELWKCDSLQDPRKRTKAARAASNSEIVVLSAHGRCDAPAELETWINEWLDQRGEDPCAFVVLLDRHDEKLPDSHPVLTCLQRAAHESGLDLFHRFYEPAADDDEEDTSRTAAGGNDSWLAARESFHEVMPYPHWGINE